MGRYVVYYRVSTERQGKSGLGLDAQREMVERFLRPEDEVIEEFTEVQSGRRDDRRRLWDAIKLVKKTRSKLLIPRLDRFSRKVSFVSKVIDEGVDLIVADNPNVSTFHLHLLACFAEEERRLIAERTRQALAAAKRRGVVLGSHGRVLAQKKKASVRAVLDRIGDLLTELRARKWTYKQIAMYLNEEGYLSSVGSSFYPELVRIYIGHLNS